MTHGAGTLDLPGAANITTAASDVGEFVSTAANVVTCVNYTKRDGTAVAGGGALQVFQGTATFDLASATDSDIDVSGVGFTPHGIVISASSNNVSASWWTVDDAGTGGGVDFYVTGNFAPSGNTWLFRAHSTSAVQTFSLESVDSDGFRLASTRIGSTAGSMVLKYLCIGFE